MEVLEKEGYQYIVGALLANTSKTFIKSIASELKRQDGSVIRLSYPNLSYDVVCAYSEQRAKRDKQEFDKQIVKALQIISKQESGKRTKFVQKSKNHQDSFVLNEELKEKAEKLIGIKGYCTNISESILTNVQIIQYYHGLWQVEQAFRMSKTRS